MTSALLKRLRALERVGANGPMQTLSIDSAPNAAQRRVIAEAIRTGQRLAVLIAKGDTLWIAGNGQPPWELPRDLKPDHCV